MRNLLFAIGVLGFSSLGLSAETAPNVLRSERGGLFEIAPQLGWVDQRFPFNGALTSFRSHWNPGLMLRFTPVWREKYPIALQFGGLKVDEQDDAGITVQGEHGSVKYIWNFRAHFGFHPLAESRWLLYSGFEFNHEPFLRQLDATTVHLNKAMIPTLALGSVWEYWRTPGFSALMEVWAKVPFSVPMDAYLIRNGIGYVLKGGARIPCEGRQLSASIFYERLTLDTTLGDADRATIGLELAIAWGDNL